VFPDNQISNVKTLFFAGENRPTFAKNYDRLTANCSSGAPQTQIAISDDESSQVTAGGLNTDEINPKTMESKLVKVCALLVKL